MNIGVISYAIGGISFLVLFLLLLTSWRGRLKGGLLVMAVFVTLLWAVVAAGSAYTQSPHLAVLYQFLEVARNVAWLAFLFQLFEPLAGGKSTLARVIHWWRPGLFAFAGLLLLADLFPHYVAVVFPAFSVDIGILGHVILAVSGLALIEQLFRNTRPDQRWAIKFLYIGIGTLFAYDFFFYADALLFKRIDNAIWQARGLVNAMIAPFIAVSAARNPQWSLDVFVSRRMVIHSASIFGAGLYLLVMAAVGYYIRFYGGTWGSAVQTVFLFGAGLLLLMMLFSGQLRASIKVFLSKHFFSYKYDYRDEWLKFIGTLSASDSTGPLRERAIRAIAEILDSPGGLLWMRGEGGNYHLAATWNLNGSERTGEPGDSSLVGFLERRQWVIDLDEYRNEPELYQDLTLPPWLTDLPRAWLIIPLMQLDDLQGFVVLARSRTDQQKINWEDRDLLKTAGRQVASYVALVDTTEALMDARQFEAFNRLSAYVVHDLKNVAGQLSLVATNATRHKDNPAFIDDALRTVENATARMNRMLAQLRKGTPTAGEARPFRLDETVREVITAQSVRRPVPVLTGCDSHLILRTSRERFSTVLGHLIQNAQEATGEQGSVEVKIYRRDQRAVIEITDNGCGMDERFIRERLFRPFNTTKGNAGMGIGVYESREFVHALGGEIDVISKPGAGTTFSLRLPLFEKKTVSQESHYEMEVLNCVSQPRSY